MDAQAVLGGVIDANPALMATPSSRCFNGWSGARVRIAEKRSLKGSGPPTRFIAVGVPTISWSWCPSPVLATWKGYRYHTPREYSQTRLPCL